MILQQQFSSKTSDLETGLEFIINHFDSSILYFPRTIMTKKLSYQKEVYSKQEVLQYFQQSNFLDCRINAFRYSNSSEKWNPDLIFIDLDKNKFQNNLIFENVLINTLKNIKTKLGDKAIPTVLNSGGGYHIILPIECPIPLENIQEFQEFDSPSKQFLRFAKDYLSNGKADKNNNPSFKSCLLRIPGSINSKHGYIIQTIQKWNGIRPNIPREFSEDFKRYMKQKDRQKILLLNSIQRKKNDSNIYYDYSYYEWIDKKILSNPFEDYRKMAVNLILVPYLLVVKKLSFEESFDIINEWLKKCALKRELDFNPKYLLNTALNTAYKKQIPPMNIRTLKTNYKDLYFLLEQKE